MNHSSPNSGELQNSYISFCRRKVGAFCKIEESKCAKLSKAQSHLQLDPTSINVQVEVRKKMLERKYNGWKLIRLKGDE